MKHINVSDFLEKVWYIMNELLKSIYDNNSALDIDKITKLMKNIIDSVVIEDMKEKEKAN